ncbi:unnamed protein product [Boreogadus saida]
MSRHKLRCFYAKRLVNLVSDGTEGRGKASFYMAPFWLESTTLLHNPAFRPHSVSAPGLGRSSSGLLEPLRCLEQVQGLGQCRGGLVVMVLRSTSTMRH